VLELQIALLGDGDHMSDDTLSEAGGDEASGNRNKHGMIDWHIIDHFQWRVNEQHRIHESGLRSLVIIHID